MDIGEKNIKYAVIACVSLAIATGIYQAFFYLTIANLIGFLFAKLYDDEINFGVLADIFLKLVLIVIPSLVGYYVISKLGINLFYQREIDYSGYTNAPSYISGQISWRANSIAECFLAIEKV